MLHRIAIAIPLIGFTFSAILASLHAITVDEGVVLSWVILGADGMTFQTMRFLRGRRSGRNLRRRGLNGEARHWARSTQRTAILGFIAKALITFVGVVIYIRLEIVRSGTTPLPDAVEAWVTRWTGDILRWGLTAAFAVFLSVDIVWDRDWRELFTLGGHPTGEEPEDR